MTQFSATFYAVIVTVTILFQICLIAGAPWGEITQGGQNAGALPMQNRVFAGISIFLLLFMGMAVLSAAGNWPNWPIRTAWIALAVQALSTILNWITPSAKERMVWGPTTSLMLMLVLIVVFLG